MARGVTAEGDTVYANALARALAYTDEVGLSDGTDRPAAEAADVVELVRCNCESIDCPSTHRVGACPAKVPLRTNRVQYLGETCAVCFPHYRVAGFAL